jgi:hypothetical protein
LVRPFNHVKGNKIAPKWVVIEAFYTQNIPKISDFRGKIAAQPRKYRVRNGGNKKKSKIPIF